MGNLFEQSGAQIVCKIWWNNWVENFCGNMGGIFCDKIGWTIKLNIHVENLLKNVGQKLAGKIRWNIWVEELSWESSQCTVCWGSPCVPQFVEGAVMLLSLGSGTFRQTPTLPHPSRGGGSNCPTRWSQLSDKVVLIVRQRLFCRTI